MSYRPQWKDRVAYNDREWSVWHHHDAQVDLVDIGDWDVTRAITVPTADVVFLWRPPPDPPRAGGTDRRGAGPRP